MLKYDLPDLGYKYKGAATTKKYKHEVLGWEITDIPIEIDKEIVEKEISKVLNTICALEIPTSYQCNLRCKYCYIDDPRMKNKKVSKDVVTKILINAEKMLPKLSKEYINNDKKRIAHISPWGAEPLANVDTLDAIYEFCHEVYGKDKYTVGTSTNGTIWSGRVQNFLKNLMEDNAINNIQISLDGPQYIQDNNRPYTNGKGSFEDIKQFVYNFDEFTRSFNNKRSFRHFCSTIHLQDDDFAERWRDAAIFFSEPNTWHTTLPFLPMRMSGEDMYGKEEISKFVNAQKMVLEVIKNRAKQGLTVLDFYTAKLFENIDCKSRNAFPFCSAMNTQIGVNIDGGMYPCHGAMTQPTYKPWLWFGNLFERTLDYSKIKRNIHYQFNSWSRAKCTDCQIYHYSSGSICWSCAPHNLSVSGEPTIDNLMKCKAYTKSFPYWVEIAKMNIKGNPILDEIDMPHPVKQSKNTLQCIKQDMHFDRNFDGIISKSVNKICDCDIDIQNMYYADWWWDRNNHYKDV
jgi:radical SAM protein with 4Fe4S-binding SPASM domain